MQQRAYTIDHVVLSDHKPVAFSLTLRNRHVGGPPPLAPWTFTNPKFGLMVTSLYNPDAPDRAREGSARNLSRLIWSMATASEYLMGTAFDQPPNSSHERFQIVRAALVAFRNQDHRRLRKLASAMDTLTPWCHGTWDHQRERDLMAMAETEHKQCVQQDLQRAHSLTSEAEKGNFNTKKAAGRAMRRIKKREAGQSDIYSCMHDPRLGEAGPDTIVEGPAKVVGAVND